MSIRAPVEFQTEDFPRTGNPCTHLPTRWSKMLALPHGTSQCYHGSALVISKQESTAAWTCGQLHAVMTSFGLGWPRHNPQNKDATRRKERRLEAPKHLARIAHDLYFEPKYEEFRPRTVWSLSNAFTSAFKELDPIPQFRATAKLGEFLESRFSQSF
jgi:hypothetical protein